LRDRNHDPGVLGAIIHEDIATFLRIPPQIKSLRRGGDIFIQSLPSKIAVDRQAVLFEADFPRADINDLTSGRHRQLPFPSAQALEEAIAGGPDVWGRGSTKRGTRGRKATMAIMTPGRQSREQNNSAQARARWAGDFGKTWVEWSIPSFPSFV
jgi:hypothetical protein